MHPIKKIHVFSSTVQYGMKPVHVLHSLTSKTNCNQYLSKVGVLHKYIEQASTVEVATDCQSK